MAARRPASARGLSASDAVLRSERPRKALAPASSASQFRVEGASSERWSKEAAQQGQRSVAGGGTSALSASQLELYSALFGASEARGWAPASNENNNNMPVEAGGCGAEEPPDQAQQIERAVRKAMRGAAVERQQAVAAAVEEAQKAAAASLAAAHAGVEKSKATAAAAEVALREAEATHQQATRAAEKEHARAVARAVERAEKAKDVAWQAALERQRKESQLAQEAMQQEREALYLAYISPISPLYLPISPCTGARGGAPQGRAQQGGSRSGGAHPRSPPCPPASPASASPPPPPPPPGLPAR